MTKWCKSAEIISNIYIVAYKTFVKEKRTKIDNINPNISSSCMFSGSKQLENEIFTITVLCCLIKW